jgi:hypothetical protein
MNEKYFAVPKVLFSIGDRFLLSQRDKGVILEAIFEYFVGGVPLETVTDGMSKTLEDITTCIICMMEEDL